MCTREVKASYDGYGNVYAFVVKSVSNSDGAAPLSEAFSQVHASAMIVSTSQSNRILDKEHTGWSYAA